MALASDRLTVDQIFVNWVIQIDFIPPHQVGKVPKTMRYAFCSGGDATVRAIVCSSKLC